jgi:hypothetical protein
MLITKHLRHWQHWQYRTQDKDKQNKKDEQHGPYPTNKPQMQLGQFHTLPTPKK